MNETTTNAITGLLENESDEPLVQAVSTSSKAALLMKAGKTDLLIIILLIAEFGPEITSIFSHVPGCG